MTVEGDLDLRGTLGISRHAPVGFAAIRVRFDIDAPEATEHQRRSLQRTTEAYCVVMQTLLKPPAIDVSWGAFGSVAYPNSARLARNPSRRPRAVARRSCSFATTTAGARAVNCSFESFAS